MVIGIFGIAGVLFGIIALIAYWTMVAKKD